jgi:hypothetical protein
MRDTITVTDTHPMSELKSKLKDGYVGVAGEKQGNQYTRGLVMARRL